MVATLLERRLTSRQAHLRNALVDLILSQGFSHLTMDQFAAQLNCSKRSLYALASSKEQLAVLAVRHFFKRATDQVEAAIAHTRTPAKRVTRYLEAVAEALRPASRAFRDDITNFRPATEIYEQNTITAAQRVRELIDEGTRAGAFRRVPAAFVGEVVTATMRRITSGEIAAATGLSDADAYSELAKLLVAAIRR
jgi:AcrR family transcriptional regulator